MKMKALTFKQLNAIAGETGELCNLLKKKHLSFMRDKMPDEAIAKEIADVVIYALLTANNQGIDLERAIIDKFNEVSKRVKSKIRL